MATEENNFVVGVEWTDWLEEGSEHFDDCDVLYMYSTRTYPMYIGEAGNQSVRQRLIAHETDGVIDYLKKQKAHVRIKVRYSCLIVARTSVCNFCTTFRLC